MYMYIYIYVNMNKHLQKDKHSVYENRKACITDHHSFSFRQAHPFRIFPNPGPQRPAQPLPFVPQLALGIERNKMVESPMVIWFEIGSDSCKHPGCGISKVYHTGMQEIVCSSQHQEPETEAQAKLQKWEGNPCQNHYHSQRHCHSRTPWSLSGALLQANQDLPIPSRRRHCECSWHMSGSGWQHLHWSPLSGPGHANCC